MLRFCCVVVLVVGLGALPPFRGAWKRPSALRSMNFKGQTFRPNKGQRQLLVRSEGTKVKLHFMRISDINAGS